ncbi:MAG: type II toxin-antitoxin system VapC family toxin [Gemmatimonadaceae bacterium]|nr:type II toxin-antitoxin system VapC family toxin [Gemmatimonadaceae bacterium]
MISRGVVLDSSAIVAMICREANAMALADAVESAWPRLVSSASVLECTLVLLQRFGANGDLLLDEFLRDFRVEAVAFDAEQLRCARDGARRFGRGRHAAALSYGDCFSYALATTRGLPLLYVGNDFASTDVSALPY